MKTINEEIVEWAKKYVPIFNELSTKYQTPYYTQSPLSVLENHVDCMIIGINPKGKLGTGSSVFENPENFLKGNPDWSSRFCEDGTISPNWGKGHRYLPDTHFFLGYDSFYHSESIDNDKKTIWTNLTPFVSDKGNNDVLRELMSEGIKSTLELIKIVKPKYIVLLGKEAFAQLKKNSGDAESSIQYSHVFSNVDAQIGYIFDIPTVCVRHPAGSWEVSKLFIPMFIFLHKMTVILKNRSPHVNMVEYMRNEMTLWQEKVSKTCNS